MKQLLKRVAERTGLTAPTAAPRADAGDRISTGTQLLLCGLVVVMLLGGLATGLFAQPSLFALGTLGIGIAPDAQAHVFDRFFRASEEVPGTGLGLSISHAIVASHDGALTVASTPGVGSTFTITLPASAEARSPR